MTEHNEIHDIWDEQLVGMAFSFKNLLEEIYGKEFTATKKVEMCSYCGEHPREIANQSFAEIPIEVCSAVPRNQIAVVDLDMKQAADFITFTEPNLDE